jgi:uncharacterized membrane protein
VPASRIFHNYLISGSKMILIGLGLAFIVSGVEHLWQSDSFIDHYIRSGIGQSGPWIIDVLQLVAGIGLVVSKRRHWVACGVAVVMFSAMINHVRLSSPAFPWMAFCIFILSALTAFVLLKVKINN